MTDNRKGHPPEDEFDIDFGDFGADAPPGGPPGEDYFEEMPDPAKSHAAPLRARAPEPADEFEDLASGFGDDEAPVAPARHEPRAEARRAPPAEDFGDDDDAPAVPPARPLGLRGAKPAPAAAALDDEPGFDDEERDGRHGAGHGDDDIGFEAERGADEEGADDAPADEEPAERPKRNLGPLAIYAAGGVFALIAGFTGWTFVAKPMLGLDAPAAVATNRQVMPVKSPVQASAAATLPGTLPGGPAPSLPGVPSLPPARPVTQSAELPGQRAVQAGMPVQDAAALPSSLPATRGQDLSRGAAMDPAVAERIARLEERISELSERRQAPDLTQKVRDLETRLAAAESRNVPPAPKPEVSVPLKPQVLDGWTLQGVNRNTAWVKGPGGLVEAREGTTLPGAGRVTGIQRYNKDYIVVTETGVIMREMRN